VDDRLIGAVAFSWPFSKEAVVGITPIEQMNRIRARGAERPKMVSVGSLNLAPLLHPSSLFLEEQLRRLQRNWPFSVSGNAHPIVLPLIFQGFPASTIDRWAPAFQKIGFLATQGGKISSLRTPDREGLDPGDMIGVELVRGDLSIGAVGTVTSVENGQILAFGHSLLNLGQVDLPMSRAIVHTIVSSLYQSLKMASIGNEIGVLRQDRVSGTLGRLDQRAKMIPVRIALENSDGDPTHYRYSIISHQQLSPLLLAVTLGGILEAEVQALGPGTFHVQGNIGLLGFEDVRLDDLFSGETAQNELIGQLGGILHVLYHNGLTVPEISGIALHIKHSNVLSKAKLAEIWFDSNHLRPGEPIEIALFLDPYAGDRIRHTISFEIPQMIYEKNLILRISGAEGMRGLETPKGEIHLQHLQSLIKIINTLRTNKNVYVSLYVSRPSYFVDGSFLTNVPPSIR